MVTIRPTFGVYGPPRPYSGDAMATLPRPLGTIPVSYTHLTLPTN